LESQTAQTNSRRAALPSPLNYHLSASFLSSLYYIETNTN
jgi:hypothetical protein